MASRYGRAGLVLVVGNLKRCMVGLCNDGLGATDAVEGILNFVAYGNKWLTLRAIQGTFFALGTCLDDTALLLIIAPVYVPTVASLGFSLVRFDVLYVINTKAAFITPPFGHTLFLIRGVVPKGSRITITDIYRSIIPFVGMQAVCLGMVMAFPQNSTVAAKCSVRELTCNECMNDGTMRRSKMG